MSSANVDLSDPKLAEAWKDVTNDKTQTNWVIVGLPANSEKVEVVASGTTGLKGLKTQLKSNTARVLFGALRIDALDKRAAIVSRRPKFVAFAYVGSSCTELQRANSSFIKNKVMQVFNSAHLTIDISGKEVDEMLSEKVLTKRLHSSTAAHKPTHYNFGDSTTDFSVEEIEAQEESDSDFDD